MIICKAQTVVYNQTLIRFGFVFSLEIVAFLIFWFIIV